LTCSQIDRQVCGSVPARCEAREFGSIVRVLGRSIEEDILDVRVQVANLELKRGPCGTHLGADVAARGSTVHLVHAELDLGFLLRGARERQGEEAEEENEAGSDRHRKTS
jgi:hypothetical protein